MSINGPVAPESMRAFISIGVLLPMVWICSGSPVPLQSVIEWTMTGVGSEDCWEGSRGMASKFSVQQLGTDGLAYLLWALQYLSLIPKTYWSNGAWVSPLTCLKILLNFL